MPYGALPAARHGWPGMFLDSGCFFPASKPEAGMWPPSSASPHRPTSPLLDDPLACSSAAAGVLSSLPNMSPEALQHFRTQLAATGSEKGQRDLTKKMLVGACMHGAGDFGRAALLRGVGTWPALADAPAPPDSHCRLPPAGRAPWQRLPTGNRPQQLHWQSPSRERTGQAWTSTRRPSPLLLCRPCLTGTEV